MSDIEEEKTPEVAEESTPDVPDEPDEPEVPIAAEIVAPVGDSKAKKKMDKSVTSPVNAVAVEVEEGATKGSEKITVEDEGEKKPSSSPKKKKKKSSSGSKKKKKKSSSTGGGSSTKASAKKESEKKDSCCTCSMILAIINIVKLFLVGILYLCGSIFFHPGVIEKFNDLPDEPYAFFIVGSLLFLSFTIFELLKKRTLGVVQLIASILNLVGALLWFISSCFVFRKTFDYLAFGGCWLTGSILNLTAATMYMTSLFLKGSKPFFEVCSLAAVWIGNLMFLCGAAMLISVYTEIFSGSTDDGFTLYVDDEEGDTALFNQPGNPDFGSLNDLQFADDEVDITSAVAAFWADKCDVKDYAGFFISASMMYLFYGVFYTLSIFKSNITFSVHFGKAPELEEDSDEEE